VPVALDLAKSACDGDDAGHRVDCCADVVQGRTRPYRNLASAIITGGRRFGRRHSIDGSGDHADDLSRRARRCAHPRWQTPALPTPEMPLPTKVTGSSRVKAVKSGLCRRTNSGSRTKAHWTPTQARPRPMMIRSNSTTIPRAASPTTHSRGRNCASPAAAGVRRRTRSGPPARRAGSACSS
jgi:hypothetical protein